MTEATQTEILLQFFKALADANRLKIVGILAQRSQSVEQLAAALDLDSSTVSHHLRKLSEAGLVEARAESYYSIYSLRSEVLHEKAQSILGDDQLPKLAQDADLDAYDRKVLRAFTDEHGRFKAFPVQQKKYLVLVRHALEAFDVGVDYSEKEVNMILSKFHTDTATLRRSMIDNGFMDREGGGARYWRVP